MSQLLVDQNLQKTHYSIDLAKRKRQRVEEKSQAETQKEVKEIPEKNAENAVKLESKDLTPAVQPEQKHNTPFRALYGESAAHVKHRYGLYQKIWGHQKKAIERILNSANVTLFANLERYVEDPLSDRLDTAFLGLSSNTANNLRLLDEFSLFINTKSSFQHVKMVRLNSKVCVNIKAAVRELIKQIVEGTTAETDTEEPPEEGLQEEDLENESLAESDDGEDEEEDEGPAEVTGGRISYDFEIVQDWMDAYMKKHKCEDSLRLIIVFDDTDGFDNEILNRLLQLLCIYSNRYPIKLVMALSSRNVGDWINANIISRLRTLIESVKLEARDNKDIGFQVIDEILLQNEITTENPLLIDAYLSLIILNRFENSNNSIDSLITELKLSYMIHFYQLPLPVLIDPSFVPEKFHYDALRKLPSFKLHMEDLVHKFEQDPAAHESTKILRLLLSNKELKALFDESKIRIQKYQNAVMNAVNMVYWLCGGATQKFQIYKLITNNQFVNSAFSSGLLKKVASYNEEEFDEFTAFIYGPHIKDSVGAHSDDDVTKLKRSLGVSAPADLKALVTEYFNLNKHLNMKISDNLFNEVLTINGGRSELDELKPPASIEENYDNLMIHLIRPNHRELLEAALDEPQKYLRNPLIMESIGRKKHNTRLLGPPLCKLYQVYKDAPVNINLWDFYVAFKLSLLKKQIIAEIDRHVQNSSEDVRARLSPIMEKVKDPESEDTWDKMVYGWFIQGCYELNAMGFLKEKVKGDYMDKLIWKNL